MTAKLDKSLCRECQSRPIEYRTTITGRPLKHGKCRECHERQAAWSQVGGPREADGQVYRQRVKKQS